MSKKLGKKRTRSWLRQHQEVGSSTPSSDTQVETDDQGRFTVLPKLKVVTRIKMF